MGNGFVTDPGQLTSLATALYRLKERYDAVTVSSQAEGEALGQPGRRERRQTIQTTWSRKKPEVGQLLDQMATGRVRGRPGVRVDRGAGPQGRRPTSPRVGPGATVGRAGVRRRAGVPSAAAAGAVRSPGGGSLSGGGGTSPAGGTSPGGGDRAPGRRATSPGRGHRLRRGAAPRRAGTVAAGRDAGDRAGRPEHDPATRPGRAIPTMAPDGPGQRPGDPSDAGRPHDPRVSRWTPTGTARRTTRTPTPTTTGSRTRWRRTATRTRR